MVESRVDSKGVTIQVFRPAGRPQYATACKSLTGLPSYLDAEGDDLQMQYLISVIHDQAGLATPDEMAAIDVFNDRLQAEGHWASPAASPRPTRPPSSTTGVRRRWSPTGPFWSPRSISAAFWIIEAPDLDVALKLAAEGSKQCNRRVEVRPFL